MQATVFAQRLPGTWASAGFLLSGVRGLMVFHVVTPPAPLIPSTGAAEDLPVLPPLQLGTMTEAVRRFSGTTDARAGNCTEVLVVEGNPLKEILRKAETLPADLLVMGTHGR